VPEVRRLTAIADPADPPDADPAAADPVAADPVAGADADAGAAARPQTLQ
jgi:hypothetical protein